MTGTTYALAELNKETTIGGQGTTVAREVPTIDMADFANRKARIADALWEASTEIGFFMTASGFCSAWRRKVTAISASAAAVVP